MITIRYTLLSILIFLHTLSSSAIADPAVNPVVDMQTNHGLIQIELFPNKAPITVANFLKHVNNKFYDKKLFHRVIKGFIIQAGHPNKVSDPNNDLPQQDPIDLTPIELENTQSTGLSNQRGSIAMARTNSSNTATAITQFFISTVNNDFLDYSNSENPGYAVFGQVIEGIDIVDKIDKVKTGVADQPNEAVIIESIRLYKKEEPTTIPITPEEPAETIPAQLSFDSVQDSYVAGETVTIILNELDTLRQKEVDLWVAIQLTEGTFLYLSKKDTLTTSPVPFKNSVKIGDTSFHALDFTVPEGFLGRYTFYAIFNQVGTDLSDLDRSLRSNIATIDVNLVNSIEIEKR